MQLYRKYRPNKLFDVVGQTDARKVLHSMLAGAGLPQAIMFTGPSGCGKTTLARILRRHLRCHQSDFNEVNCADIRGIEHVREIRRQMPLAPVYGHSKIWLIDEAHKLTKDAQNALLKMLEDTPRNVYFMLCTTEPQGLIRTIHTRCTPIKLKPLNDTTLRRLIAKVAGQEGVTLSSDVLDKIAEVSEGSARQALVYLDAVISLDTEEEQLAAVSPSSVEEEAISLARALIQNKPSWVACAKILRGLEKEDPEGIRYLVLAYARKVLLGGKSQAGRAAVIIDVFRFDFYTSKHAGLALACYYCCQPQK